MELLERGLCFIVGTKYDFVLILKNEKREKKRLRLRD